MPEYGIRTLAVTSPVQTPTEPVALADVATYLHIDHTHEDANIATLISAAREYAESVHGRDLIAATFDLSLDYWREVIYLGEGLTSVTSVTYKDEDGVETTLVENTDYIVDTRRGTIQPMPDESWPTDDLWPTSAITIRYTVTPVVPEAVKVAIMRLVSHCHVNRLPFEMVAGSPNEWPIDVTRLLKIGARTVLP